MSTNTIIEKEAMAADEGSLIIERVKSMISSVLKKWWLFLIVGFCAGVLGVIKAGMEKPQYESRLTFALDQNEGGGMSGAINFAAQLGLNIGGGKDIFGGDNIIEILKSRRMVEKVLLSVDTFNSKPYTFAEYYLELSNKRNARTKDIHFPIGQKKSEFSYLQDSLLFIVYSQMSRDISASRPDRKLSLYEVRITSDDEKFAKVFTDRLVSETNNFYTEICSKKSRETMEILQQRVSFMKGNLDTSLSNKALAQDVNLNPAFAAAQVPVLKQQMNIQVYGAAYGEMFKNLELARYNYLKQIPLMQIIDAADYPMKKIKVSRLKTGIFYSIFSCLVTLLIVWVIGIVKYRKLHAA